MLDQPHYLYVSNSHQIAYWDIGPRHGQPLLFLHGGPGSYSKPHHLDILPSQPPIRAILFDQRGCGQSLPFGSLQENTTSHLITDIDKLRRHLHISSWYLYGNSWGSTLALLYAQQYPHQVKGLILRSIFLARHQDNSWLYQPQGASLFQPDFATQLQNYLKTHHLTHQDFPSHAYRLLLSDNLAQQQNLVSLILNWEYSLMQFEKPTSPLRPQDVTQEMIASTRLYLHYLVNNFFIADNHILAHCQTIAHLPTIIVHGRYDFVSPPVQAYLLHQHLPHSQLFFVNHAGHHFGWDGKQFLRHLISDLLS